MSIPENLTRAEGFPTSSVSTNGHSWTDQYYRPYIDESSLKWDGDPIGSECPFDPFLVLGSAAGSRKNGAFAYFDLQYVPYGNTPVIDTNKPTFELRGGTSSLALETRTGYLTKWNYNLVYNAILYGNYPPAKPAWFDTAKITYLSPSICQTTQETTGTDKQKYGAGTVVVKWSKDIPDGWLVVPGCLKTKEADGYSQGTIQLDEVYYFSDLMKALSYANQLNLICSPKTKLPMSGDWLCTGFTVTPDPKKITVRITYQFSRNGFDVDLYDVNTTGGGPQGPGGLVPGTGVM